MTRIKRIKLLAMLIYNPTVVVGKWEQRETLDRRATAINRTIFYGGVIAWHGRHQRSFVHQPRLKYCI